MHVRSAVLSTAASSLLLALAMPVGAQCQLEWSPGLGMLGTDAPVYAMHRWDPDGAGPAPLQLVVGGNFLKAGTISAGKVAAWDPATGAWTTFGSGTAGYVFSFATASNGDLIVGGIFSSIGGIQANGVARWNGTTWSALGPGINGAVNDIAVLPNGDLVVVGTFTTTGALTVVQRVARWNGATWSPLGSGSPSNLYTVLALANGDVVVGGQFSSIGGIAADNIARWDGATWQPIGGGVVHATQPSSGIVRDLALLPSGDLVVGGAFTQAGGVPASNVAAWDGSTWRALGSGLAGVVSSLAVEANGGLLANAPLAANAPAVSRWNGSAWQTATQATAGSGLLTTLPGGDIVLGGTFTVADPAGKTLQNLARWNGSAWTNLASPATTPWFSSALTPYLRGIATTPDGTLYAIGPFQIVDGAPLNGIARFNGSTWDAVGSPLGIGSWPFPYPYPLAILAMKNGDIVVGGRITGIAGGPAGHVVRWNGTSWSNLGGGVGSLGAVNALAELPSGDLVIGGNFLIADGAPADHIARWDGVAWHPMGAGATGGVTDLLVSSSGDVVAAGNFTNAAGPAAQYLARWNGSSWSPLGPGPGGPVLEIELLPNGDVAVLTASTSPASLTKVQRWNGAIWTQLGAAFPFGFMTDLVGLPNGDLLLSGYISLPGGAFCKRWDGATWNSVPTTDVGFDAHTWLPDGDLVVAGSFAAAGPWLSPTLARLHATCTARATVAGSGCVGSGGDNKLRATALPWLGSTFRAAGTELPGLALVSKVWGFAPTQLPLAVLLPQALPGCDLLVTPDYFELAITTDGTLATALAIPADPALVGLQVHHQLNLFEVDAGLNVLEVTASNALLLTTGVF